MNFSLCSQSVGIAVEFCAHIARYFAVHDGPNRLERARLALSEMGSSVSDDFLLVREEFH